MDPVGNKTAWEYDRNGNLTKETDPLGKTRTWAFDAAGRLVTATDRLGRVNEFEYFNNNLLDNKRGRGQSCSARLSLLG